MAGADEDARSDEEHRALAESLYRRWEAGESKSSLEVDVWGDASSHGKRFTSYIRRWLDRETEKKSSQTEHVERLEGLLRAHGISPSDAGDLDEEHRLVAKARESALAGVRVYNDPLAGFRTETLILLMVIAWNSLFQAILERDSVDYYERGQDGKQVLLPGGRPKVLDTWALACLAIGGDGKRAVRANLDFFLGLRNQIAHRYLPALDTQVTAEAQAMLLNFENLLVEEFGGSAALGEQLSVPLQLSGFRNAGSLASLKAAESQLPTDVMNYLCRHREDVDEDVLRSHEYALQVYFVPVTANRDRQADTMVRFFPPGTVPPHIEEGLRQTSVVTKPKVVPVSSHDLFLPGEVVNLVAERLPFRFTMDTHTRCWRHYKVRPPSTSGEREPTDSKYCRYDRLKDGYGYTQAWIDKLVRDLTTLTRTGRLSGSPRTHGEGHASSSVPGSQVRSGSSSTRLRTARHRPSVNRQARGDQVSRLPLNMSMTGDSARAALVRAMRRNVWVSRRLGDAVLSGCVCQSPKYQRRRPARRYRSAIRSSCQSASGLNEVRRWTALGPGPTTSVTTYSARSGTCQPMSTPPVSYGRCSSAAATADSTADCVSQTVGVATRRTPDGR